MSDNKISVWFGLIGTIVGLICFSFQYFMYSSTFPAYDLLVAPAKLMLSFFSEETNFWPKFMIFIFGQFCGYLVVGFVLIKFYRFQGKLLKRRNK